MAALFRKQPAKFISKPGEAECGLLRHTPPEYRPSITSHRTVGGNDDDILLTGVLPDVAYCLKHSLAEPCR